MSAGRSSDSLHDRRNSSSSGMGLEALIHGTVSHVKGGADLHARPSNPGATAPTTKRQAKPRRKKRRS